MLLLAGSIIFLKKKRSLQILFVIVFGLLSAYALFCAWYTVDNYQRYSIRLTPAQFVQDVATAMVLLPLNQISLYRYGQGIVI